MNNVENAKRDRKAVVVFAGFSVETTPKLLNISRTLEKRFSSVSTIAIVKSSRDGGTTNRFVIGAPTLIGKFAKLTLAFVAAVKAARKERADLIYAVNPLAGLVAVMAQFRTPTRIIYETHELFCGVNYKLFTGRSRHIWRWVETTVIRRSIIFFATDEFRLKFLRRYYRLKGIRGSYLLNVPSASQVMSSGGSTSFARAGRFVVSYCGGIEKGRAVEEILRAFALANVGESVLLLVGPARAEYRSALIALSIDIGIRDSVIFTGPVSNELLRAHMAASDVTIALYDKSCLNNRLCSPNKIFDALHAGTMLITSSAPLTRRVIGRTNAGVLVDKANPVEIAEAIKRLASLHPDKLLLRATANKYRWEREEAKLLRAIDEIVEQGL